MCQQNVDCSNGRDLFPHGTGVAPVGVRAARLLLIPRPKTNIQFLRKVSPLNMLLKRLLPYIFSACALCSYSVGIFAQNTATRPRRVFALAEEVKPQQSLIAKNKLSAAKFQRLISEAIEERLGAPYRWSGTGPDSYDCSGFVWATFQSAGIDFERVSAATLWAQLLPPPEPERFTFGTLVFFSGQTHVGIVADERGFYHASRQRGVVYDEFSDYWLERIDGFRRVPLPGPPHRADE